MAATVRSDVSTAKEPQHSPRFDGLRFEGLTYAGDHPERATVIFDGDCVFCLKGVRHLKRFDWGGKRLAYVSLHDPLVAERYPRLSHEDMMSQMYVVDTSGVFHGGASALRYLSRQLPMLWLTAPLLHIPFSLPLWQTGYQWIANRRYRIAGRNNPGSNGDAACEGSCHLHGDTHGNTHGDTHGDPDGED